MWSKFTSSDMTLLGGGDGLRADGAGSAKGSEPPEQVR